jgi:hypothetical protein
MSAALQLPTIWDTSTAQAARQIQYSKGQYKPAQPGITSAKTHTKPAASLAFYRKHTESLLRRYLYASMQVGRAPSILGDPIARGWASSRPVRTFEDAVIFVLDIEKCLGQIGWLEREMLSRIVLQEYTQAETAMMLGMSVRSISYKFATALDRLTEKVLDAGLLVLPHA